MKVVGGWYNGQKWMVQPPEMVANITTTRIWKRQTIRQLEYGSDVIGMTTAAIPWRLYKSIRMVFYNSNFALI